MALSNAERQRRFRQRLKEKASRNETVATTLAEAWELASIDERRAFCEQYELIGPSEQALLGREAVDDGKRQAGEVFNAHVDDVVKRELRAAGQPASKQPRKNRR